ncbi:MAG: hypothetical protein JSR17_03980 [Proteobacteria bacterium]|nr:hypothetical protein [Pseudomonadota bacterium]
MAKTKKAPPKKASIKKTSVKKPNTKGVKKPIKAKANAKKAKQPSAKKTAKKKAPSAKKSEDVILQQTFMDSLAKLENYWSKKVNTLSKELNALIAKEQKAMSAKNSNHANQVKKHQQLAIAVVAKRDELLHATLAADKFSALGKKIAQFEKEWLQQLNQHAPDAHAADDHGAHEDHTSSHAHKNHAKKTKPETFVQEWDQGQENEEEITDDLEDIFMPQDDLSEFEVIEDFSVTHDDDIYDEDEA